MKKSGKKFMSNCGGVFLKKWVGNGIGGISPMVYGEYMPIYAL